MMDFWMYLWTLVFFGGVAVYAVLAVFVSYHGAHDLKVMLDSLRQRHADAQLVPETEEEILEHVIPPAPPAP